MSTDLRDYDVAMVTKLGALSVTPVLPALPYYSTVVNGVTAPVRTHSTLPEDWYNGYTLPGMAVLRVGEMPDPSRYQPAFQGAALSADPLYPNTWEIETSRPQPINMLYQVHLAAQSAAVLNALLMHVMFHLPLWGYGANVPLYGTVFPVRFTGHHDLTNYDTKDGRIFRRVLSYTVDGWMAETVVTLVKEIMHVRGEIDIEPAGQSLVPPLPPAPADPAYQTLFAADDPD